MSTTEVILLVTALVAIDALVLFGLRQWAANVFNDLTRQFPPRTHSAGALARRYQGIAVGALSFGGCFTIARDEQHVHFEPMRVARWFGAQSFSVPLDVLRAPLAPHKRGSSVKLGRFTLSAPSWALKPLPESARR